MVMERLGAAAKHPESQGRTKQFAISAARRLLRAAKVKDPGPKEAAQRRSVKTKEPRGAAKSPLEVAIAEYKTQLHTPELVTQTHQAIWQARGETVGVTYEVTPCPYTREKLADLEANGKRVGYLPAELATQQTRHKLGEIFPRMQSYRVQKGNSVANDKDPSGWFDYEAAIDAPYLDTKEGELMNRIKKDGRVILSLNQYIVAGQDSKLFTGQYPDEARRTWVRVGSRDKGSILLEAGFQSNGRLDVSLPVRADARSPVLGGRSSGVKKS